MLSQRFGGLRRGREIGLALPTLGLTSIIGQIVLMRELVAAFYGNELVLGLILAWWLFWEAVGAWALGRQAARHNWGRRSLALTLAFAALALPLQVALTRFSRDLMGVTPGAIIPFSQILWAVGVILAPYCLGHGLGFSLAARILGPASAGRAYAYESAGAVVGGALLSFLLVDRLDPFQVILAVTTVTLVIGVAVWIAPQRHPLAFGLLATIGVALSLPLGAWLQQATLSRQWPGLLFADDSRYGRIAITGSGDQRAFYVNGLLAFETESTFPEEVVHLPLLMHPLPRRVLLIGGGVAGDVGEVLKHRVDAVTYVELDPVMIEAARAHLPPEQANTLNDPRLSLVYQDGRQYVKHARESFDVVIVDLPEPSTAQLNRFYTLEFFQEVKAILKSEGVFSLGLPSAENYWSPELLRRNASVYRTLRRVFQTVLITPGEHNFLVARSDGEFPDPETLGRRLVDRKVVTRWLTAEYLDFLLTGDRFQYVQAELRKARTVKLNRDLAPICFFYDLALWSARFGSGLRSLFEDTTRLRLAWLAPPLLLGVLALWRQPRGANVALVAATGFSGMTLQIVLLLAFQALHGYVYHQVGLLVTAFMAGLAVSAGALSRRRPAAPARWIVAVECALVAYALLLAAALPSGLLQPGLLFPFLAVLAGVLTGAVFPLAAARVREPSGYSAGLLYAADLLGGCVGALASSIIVVPVLGVVDTLLAVALVAASGAVLSFRFARPGIY